MNNSLNYALYRDAAQVQPEPAPSSSFFNSPRLWLDRWFDAWAARVEARWQSADLRSRYY
ncbi:hypothetical protein LNV09_04810 [Paucibacter sp. B2R-40]|uniref:hypothetical protein n=1 Tax=Paucibacter sp. B2R-40 TaxID=2893554 RepID=UPI0021E4DE9F|nr:hypothetical protein [Paucibacter sp. B2R-40]MCV2353477.1 hypothetical protein [Paucibacter sp. B2R-40]